MKTDTFHIYIAKKFIEKKENDYNNTIKREAARKIMYLNHIPLYLHNDFLKEMVKLKLIKLKDKRNIKLIKDFEEE